MTRMLSGFEGPQERPPAWDKWVSAAHLRQNRSSQADAAKAVNVSERTLRRWEADPRWPYAMAEAKRRWMADTDALADRTIARSIEMGNVQTAMWWKERVDPEFAPPKLKMELAGKDGGPIHHEHGLVVEVVEARDEPGDDTLTGGDDDGE